MDKSRYMTEEDSDYSIGDMTFFEDGLSYEEKLKRTKDETGLDFVILENESYPTGLIGYLKDQGGVRLVYADDLMLEDLMKNNKWSYEDAEDWFGYNTMRGLPYCYTEKLRCPIVIFRNYDVD